MGTILASVLIDEAARRLNDTNNANLRWSGTDLLTSLNSAQILVAETRPEASIKATAIVMVSGFEQVLPVDGKEFLALVYNAGTDGLLKGSAIIQMQEALLDAIDGDWRSTSPTTTIKYFVPDPDFPVKFSIYPPSDGTNYAHCRYKSIPADMATAATAITIGDEYREPLILGTLWFALADATENIALRTLRKDILNEFRLSMGVKTANENQEERKVPGIPI